MGRSVKVAVIGAGVAGLSATRELQREGHQVIVFEKRDGLGGTWLYDRRTDSDPLSLDPSREIVYTSVYLSLRTNLPRQLMGFLDYPFPMREDGDARTFPGHAEVLWFLNKFAEDFGLKGLIRFNTEVVRVERVEGKIDEWVIESKTLGSVSMNREIFQAVVICTGHFTEPRLAEIPGIEKWPGYQIHSHNYRVPEPFSGQTVVLIGFGPSAFDISRDIAAVAKEVHIATRNPDVTFRKLENHENVWHHKMVEDVFENGLVVFKDGFSVFADTIFFCTGYKYHYPFLETNGLVIVDDNRVGPLYKHVFPPALAPWLCFIGIPEKDTPFQTIELQSKWVARVLSGKVLLPTKEEMTASVLRYYEQMQENGLPKHLTHALPPNEVEYRNWLVAQTGLPSLEEWREKMYQESIRCLRNMQEKYRDQWDDDYFDTIIKACAQ